ncbi:MAG: arginine--tRNA ligase [Lewinellaceae bacterium]|nr:arginine--tRNA ligase [Lewinellaceae bacterium]
MAQRITTLIQDRLVVAVKTLYGADLTATDLPLSNTRKEFVGDFTVVVFPLTRVARKKPEEIGAEIGQYLLQHVPEIVDFNVIKGFLNLAVSPRYWQDYLSGIYSDTTFGIQPANGQKVLVEFSSPNTNKPLHLGHVRNILLGWSVSRILEAAGYKVFKVQIVNDRGIAICKSMLAWKKFGVGATPESTGMKSDHFVGDYYVRFEQEFQKEYQQWQASAAGQEIFRQHAKADESEATFFKGYKDQYFNQHSALGAEAQEMLRSWEQHDPATLELWKTLNNWVYAGFNATYDRLGVSFDKLYYESDTYLLGKDMVEKGLEKDVFYREPDNSVWIDLEDAKLDRKVVQRRDGTAVYITQDLGTAELRYEDFGVEKMVYVVADEQIYHFQVLFEILKRLGAPYASGLYHLAYGMVDLPTGKMKSREGTVVDADDLIDEVIAEAWENSRERGTIADLPEKEQAEVIEQIALAALKFFIIKVNPQKRMIFDPRESVDMQGTTGPYVQNAYVRIQSVLRKAGDEDLSAAAEYGTLEKEEQDLIAQLAQFPDLIQEAARNYDPSIIANYCYNLAKAYHRYYHDFSILKADSSAARAFRLQLSTAIANTLRNGMDMLGIAMPERM